MFIFEAIDAAHGDAILLALSRAIWDSNASSWWTQGPRARGTKRATTYIPYETRVIPRLLELKEERDANAETTSAPGKNVLAIDLVVCTHIDDDHIAGVERLYGCLSRNTLSDRRGQGRSQEAVVQLILGAARRCREHRRGRARRFAPGGGGIGRSGREHDKLRADLRSRDQQGRTRHADRGRPGAERFRARKDDDSQSGSEIA